MKRGSKRAILNVLGLMYEKHKSGEVIFTDVDEAILIANALVELKSNAGKQTPEYQQIE